MAAHMEDFEDGFVSIGSAFEVLATDEDVMKAKGKKEKEFYVLDKQGRRRFHGAFTGGFSAGYFMSVGTKEGWSPAPFVSSRSQKASSQQQRPEDYMDDEDLDSFGIAPRQVSTKDKFANETQATPISHDRKRPSVIPGDPLLHTLLVPTRATIGALLMKAMGWKEGRGVGPTTVAMDTPPVKTYGCALPGNEGVELGPGDVTAWACSGGKDNLHGIGYQGLTRDHFTSAHGFNKGVYGMSGQAFGVGALEDDDDDIYSQETVAAYNASLATPTDHAHSSYGWTGGKDIGESWSLSSFIKSSVRHRYSQVYPPPIIPRGFIPVHKFPLTSGTDHTHPPVKSIAERGFLATGSGSVFDLIAPHDKDRLLKAKDSTTNKATTATVTQFSLNSYQPFKDDTEKQSRYNAYLEGNRGAIADSTRGMTDWERQKEATEFERVAKVHGPLTTALLSDRFTRAAELKDEGGGEGSSVHPTDVDMFGTLTRTVEEWHPHRILCKRFNIPDPFPHSDIVGIKSDHHIASDRNMTFEASTTQYHAPTLPPPPPPPSEQIEEQEVEKPSVTFLKSIFEDSSSDEEEMESQRPPPGPALSLATPTPPTESTITNRRPHPQDNPPKHNSPSPKRSGSSTSHAHTRDHAHVPDHTHNTEPSRWQNLAEVIQPTLSVPQKMEKPIVYVKDTFGPALPPSLLGNDTDEAPIKHDNHNHDNHCHKKHSSKHKHHKHHHNKVKKKHKHH